MSRPIQFQIRGLEVNALRAELFVKRDRRRAKAQRRSVLRGDIVDLIHRDETAGARHVPGHDGWISGYVFADVLGKQPGVDVVCAAGRIADHQIDRLSLIEVAARFRPRDLALRREGSAGKSRHSELSAIKHCILPLPVLSASTGAF